MVQYLRVHCIDRKRYRMENVACVRRRSEVQSIAHEGDVGELAAQDVTRENAALAAGQEVPEHAILLSTFRSGLLKLK